MITQSWELPACLCHLLSTHSRNITFHIPMQRFTLLHTFSAHSFAVGNYHHSMFDNPTVAVNLFHVGKQYLTFCKAEAAVTHNLIGRKMTSNSDARNSLPILDIIRLSHKRRNASVLQMNAMSNDRCLLYMYRTYSRIALLRV